jgi:hypothetical protein
MNTAVLSSCTRLLEEAGNNNDDRSDQAGFKRESAQAFTAIVSSQAITRSIEPTNI